MPSLLRTSCLVGLGVGLFLLASSVLRGAYPGPPDGVGALKLEHWSENSQRYDLLMVGSSGTFRHCVPEVMEQRFAQAGLELRVFNLGIAGMRDLEGVHMLEQALAHASDRLLAVVLEPSLFDPSFREGELRTERTQTWHDLSTTLLAIECSLESDRPWGEAWLLALDHARLGGHRLSNYGLGPTLVRGLLGAAADPSIDLEDLERNQGYQALDDLEGEEFRARREALTTAPGRLAQRLTNMRRKRRAKADVSGLHSAGVRHVSALLEESEVAAFYVMSPVCFAPGRGESLLAAGAIPNFEAFNDSDRHPELFRLENRFDLNHLNDRGARLYSRELAEYLLGELGPLIEARNAGH